MAHVRPFLWLKSGAQDAADFYARVFGARVTHTLRVPADVEMPEGDVLAVDLEFPGGGSLSLMGGNPQFEFSPAISIAVPCDTQDEIDRYWDGLSEGGKAMACGWITDRYGVTWQIFPADLMNWVSHEHGESATRVFKVMQSMIKLEIEPLERARRGE